MTKGGRKQGMARSFVMRALTGAAIGGLLFVAGGAGAHLWREVVELRAASEDNVQWSMAQLEVELLRFEQAVSVAETEGELADVRRRFDVFYSRVETLKSGTVFAALRDDRAIPGMLGKINGFLDAVVPLIDAPDRELRAALPSLLAQIQEIETISRSLSIQSVRTLAARSDAQRERFISALLTAAGLMLTFLAASTLSFIAMRARANESEHTRRRLAATVRASLDAVIAVNGDGVVIDWNGAASEVFGRTREEALGRPVDRLIIPERYRKRHREGMARFLRDGNKRVVDTGRVEMVGMRANGSEFPIELAIGLAEDETGPIFVAYLRDISARVAAERAVLASRDAAMAADRAKSEFLAVMSHEMRTPLNGVLGVLDLLGKSKLDASQRRFVDVAVSSGEILLRHINDVLDLTRAESGKMSFVNEPFDLEALLREAVEVTRPVAEMRGNALTLDIGPGLGRLRGDRHRIRQIVLNFLGNAAKFTRDGRIRLEVRALEEGAAGVLLELAVIDNGPGVQPEDRERVFMNFVTLDASYEREASGSGLGLAIVRGIVEAMSGKVGVEEAEGGGSRFWARLRLPRADTPPEEREAPAIAAPLFGGRARVLLVEDNEVNRLVVVESLKQAGYEVAEAVDGEEGVAAAARARFDLILMDISMPRMNGVEATRAIRAAAGPNRETPIVGLTAHALPDEYESFMEAGMQDCLTKPIRRGQLEAAVARFLSVAGGEGQEEAGENDGLFDEETLTDFATSLGPQRMSVMLMRLIEEMGEARQQIAERLEEGRLADIGPIAHRAAGGAAVVGAARLYASLARMETAAKTQDGAMAREALTEFDAALPETAEVLREYAGAHLS